MYGAAHCTVTAWLQGFKPLATKSLLLPAVSLTNGAAANIALKQSSKYRVQWATVSDKEGAPRYVINLCFWKLVITQIKNNVTKCWWNHKHFVQAVNTYCLSHLRIIYKLMLTLRGEKLSKVSKTKCSSKIKLILQHIRSQIRYYYADLLHCSPGKNTGVLCMKEPQFNLVAQLKQENL